MPNANGAAVAGAAAGAGVPNEKGVDAAAGCAAEAAPFVSLPCVGTPKENGMEVVVAGAGAAAASSFFVSGADPALAGTPKENEDAEPAVVLPNENPAAVPSFFSVEAALEVAG